MPPCAAGGRLTLLYISITVGLLDTNMWPLVFSFHLPLFFFLQEAQRGTQFTAEHTKTARTTCKGYNPKECFLSSPTNQRHTYEKKSVGLWILKNPILNQRIPYSACTNVQKGWNIFLRYSVCSKLLDVLDLFYVRSLYLRSSIF